jgi:Ca2+/H+ antiporter, TMEM165/GDT1 family
VQIVVTGVFLIGAVLVLRADDDDDDLSDITMANLAARYHDPVAVGIGSVLGLWLGAALAITGGRGLLRILPMRWISRLAALVMVVMAAVTLGEAIR